MCADDIHLTRVRGTDLGRIHLLAGLGLGRRSTPTGAGGVHVLEALSLVSPTLELLLDPVDRRRVARGALLTVTELRQPTNEFLIAVEIEESHDPLMHAVRIGHRNAAQDVADVPSKPWRIARPAVLRGSDPLLGRGRHRHYVG